METKVYEAKDNLQKALTNYTQINGLTIEALSKEIGCSRSVLSQIINGNYTTNGSTKTKDQIKEFLKDKEVFQEDDQQQMKTFKKPEFLITEDAKNIIGVCKSCQENKGLGIIVGKTGFGKTFTLEQYSKMSRVCYIECDDAMSCRDLIEAIEKRVGLPTGYGSTWRRINEIREFFNINTGYVLIIDEADKLISKYTQKKMEILRGIYDQSNVGLIIAGEPSLESKVKGYLARFANRVDFYSCLKGISKSEVKEFLCEFNFTEEAESEMYTRASNHQNGCFRLLDRTLKNIFRVAATQDEITPDIIRKASSMMMM